MGATYMQRQRRISEGWDRFGSIVNDYLGIPYKFGGRAVKRVTGKRTGVATRKAGLVCTSFVDVVLSRYVHNDPETQLHSYSFGKGTNIFDRYGLQRLSTKIEPQQLPTIGLHHNHVYGVVFHMKEAWTKKKKKGGERHMEAGSRIHVGVLAFRNSRLFLVHASGRRGVHIVAWEIFLRRYGDKLQNFGGSALKGPKFLSVYKMRTPS